MTQTESSSWLKRTAMMIVRLLALVSAAWGVWFIYAGIWPAAVVALLFAAAVLGPPVLRGYREGKQPAT